MDAKQADRLAKQILSDSQSTSQHRARAVARIASGLRRLYTGAVTLVGAGFGFYWSQRLFHDTLTHMVLAVVCGLVAAVAWPQIPLPPNNSSKRTH